MCEQESRRFDRHSELQQKSSPIWSFVPLEATCLPVCEFHNNFVCVSNPGYICYSIGAAVLTRKGCKRQV